MIPLLINIPSLKNSARVRMKSTKPSVYITTVVCLVISTIVSSLTFILSGATELYENVYTYVSVHGTLTYSELLDMIPQPGFIPLLLIVALNIAMALINIGYSLYCLNVSRQGKTSYKDIFNAFEQFGRAFLIYILQAVFIFLWSLLFIIPGIIASYRYSMSYYIMYDHPEYSAMECIRESKRLMSGNKMLLFIVDLSFIGWFILGYFVELITADLFLISLPLVSIFLMPYHGITNAIFYNALLVSDGQHKQAQGENRNESGNDQN